MKELAVRVSVAVVGIPLLLFIILKGGVYFYLFSVIVTLIGQWEMYQLLAKKGAKPNQHSGLFLGQLIIALVFMGPSPLVVSGIVLFLLLIFGTEMFKNDGSALQNVGATLSGVVYPTLFWSALLYLRLNIDQQAGKFVLILFISIWICDTFAYFFGMKFGKHRLFERVSPKKSWEGAIAGFIGALLTFFVVHFYGFLPITITDALVAGAIVGILGQLGDLVESWFKRDAGVKDSSAILPGHGGILDRFDSILFSAPALLVVFVLLK